jgi:hypothetical protein
VKKPVSKFAFQVHNLQRYTTDVEFTLGESFNGLIYDVHGGELQVESS